MPTLDLDRNFDEEELITPGEHLVEIVDLRCKATSSGDEMWIVEMSVIGEDPDYGKTFTDFWPFSRDGLKKTGPALKRFGVVNTLWEREDDQTYFENYAEFFKGRRAIATIHHEEYKGQIKNKVGIGKYERIEERPDDLDPGDFEVDLS